MGGDHKCPLCSATFTRPQHVGRHLRAHTGDRPYECKECPLRFARSDLLSRHVNKAHPKPSAAVDQKAQDKKGRRKSVSQTTNAATTSHPPPQPPPVPVAATVVPPPVPVVPEPTAYQAQRMYPNHPLLQQNPNWQPTHIDLQQNAQYPLSLDTSHDALGNYAMQNGIVFSQPFSAPMRMTGSDQGNYAPLPTTMQPAPFEINVKKRACDQCNHSKVRCDFLEPCARCSQRSMQCTYTKPQRMQRAHGFTVPMPASTQLGSSPQQAANSAFAHRRYSTPPHNVNGHFLASDSLLASNHMLNRPQVPEPDWKPRQGLNVLMMQQTSPVNLALTPSLTNATSPTTSDGTDRRGSQTSFASGNGWALPPSVLSREQQYAYAQMRGQPPMASSLPAESSMLWGTMDPPSPNSAAVVSEDEETPPTSAQDKRRRSSAGVWANAINQLRLDDTNQLRIDDSQGLMFDSQMQLQLAPQRHATYPMTGANGSQDVNLWKLFLDPMALSTPDKLAEGEPMETPRGLSKSNSMPDLTTPPTETAQYQGFPQPDDLPPRDDLAADDPAYNRWRHQIQARHASFSMHLSPSKRVSTQELANPSFASMQPRPVRPLPQTLVGPAALQQTLAPERVPSFGPPSFDNTPGGQMRTPTKLLDFYASFERPGNKRQASQTLVPDVNQKRATFGGFDDENGSNNASRRGSDQIRMPQQMYASFAATMPTADTRAG